MLDQTKGKLLLLLFLCYCFLLFVVIVVVFVVVLFLFDTNLNETPQQTKVVECLESQEEPNSEN